MWTRPPPHTDCQAFLLVCSGSMNQFTAIYNGSGELINHIKYYDGFMGQRVGAISCLAFHPHWVCVPAGAGGGWEARGAGGRRAAAGGVLQPGPSLHHSLPPQGLQGP